MARMTAVSLRSRAREAMLLSGGRGFMRFLPPGGALLATDALRRCRGEAEEATLIGALEAAGFACIRRDGLLELTPQDALLMSICAEGEAAIDWSSPLHPVQALGARWLGKEKQPFTDAGRQLILEALRLTWQTTAGLEAMEALRQRGAAMQRNGDSSGMHEAGAALMNWCNAQLQAGDRNTVHADEGRH